MVFIHHFQHFCHFTRFSHESFECFLFWVFVGEAYECKNVAHQLGLDSFVHGTGGTQTGKHVHFHQPGVLVLVDEDVEPEDLLAAVALAVLPHHCVLDVRFQRDASLHANVSDF